MYYKLLYLTYDMLNIKITVSENSERSLLVKLLRLGGTSGGTRRFKLLSLDSDPWLPGPIELPLAIPLGGRAGGALIRLLPLIPPAVFIGLMLPGGPGAGGCWYCPLFILWGKIGEFVASWDAVKVLVFSVPVLLAVMVASLLPPAVPLDCNVLIIIQIWLY